MKFFICETPYQQVEMFGEDSHFETDNGFFNYEVELVAEEDMIRISDALGRSIPMDISEVNDLIDVLQRIANYVGCKECVQERLYRELVQDLEVEED